MAAVFNAVRAEGFSDGIGFRRIKAGRDAANMFGKAKRHPLWGIPIRRSLFEQSIRTFVVRAFIQSKRPARRDMEAPYVVVVTRENSHRPFCSSREVLNGPRQVSGVSMAETRAPQATYPLNCDVRRGIPQG